MTKPIAAIEISSTNIKVVSGYVLNDQVHIIYSFKKPFGYLNEGGDFTNFDEIVKVLKSIKTVYDPGLRINIDVNEVILSIPPYGLMVFDTDQTTTVIGEGSKVGNIDVKNLFSLIKNSKLPTTNELTDIVPNIFLKNDENELKEPPIGEYSRSLRMFAKVLTLPERINTDFPRVVKAAGLSIKRKVVAPYGVGVLLSTYPNMPHDYILVDIGSHITTVSLIGDANIFRSSHFFWGGNTLTEKIVLNFNISETDAEKFKILYGLDYKEMKFKTPICSTDYADGTKINHYPKDLTAIIENELDRFISELNISIDTVLKGCDPSIGSLDVFVIGETSQLKGLVDYIKPKVRAKDVQTLMPTSIGARDPSLFNCLGAIYVAEKRIDSMNEFEEELDETVVRKK